MRMELKWKKMSTAMALGAGLVLGTSGLSLGQAQPAPSPNPASVDHREAVGDAQHNMGEFLGQHPELREQLNKNPNLINDPKFVSEHPEIADHWKAHPSAVMQHEQHYAEQRNTAKHHPAQKNH